MRTPKPKRAVRCLIVLDLIELSSDFNSVNDPIIRRLAGISSRHYRFDDYATARWTQKRSNY